MSSKKLIRLLVISLIYGLIVGGVAHAEVGAVKGTVSNADGTPAAGVTLLAPGFGILEDTPTTTNAEGAYYIPYISFSPTVIEAGDEITIRVTDLEGDVIEKTHTVTAADVAAGEATFNITLISTVVTVAVVPNTFSADSPSDGMITVTVEREGEGPVTDDVTLRLSPAAGSGSVGAVTNNGDGTHSATYTSGGTAGNVIITATTESNVSGTARLTINAGPPAAITVSVAPETVSSLGNATITAMVTDSNGNGVGGLIPAGTALSGTVSDFAAARAFGSYTAAYTAPMVDAEGTDTITVTADGVSGEETLNLTPVPPVHVTILDISGTVFKVDDVTPADGVTVTITVGANPPEVRTTDENGGYLVTLFSPVDTVAGTGDAVSIVVTDDTGAERGREEFRLTNDQLGEGGTGAFTAPKVVTDIIVPPRSVSILVVEGIIYSDDGVSPLEDVDITVTVTVGSNPPEPAILEEGGVYSATVVDLVEGSIASTGDLVSTVVIADADGTEQGRAELELTNAHLPEDGAGIAPLNVMTNITLPPKSVNLLVVEGVVYRDDETTPVGPGVDVAVTVGSHPVQTTQTDSTGSFATTNFNPSAAVASTGDMVSIVVSDGSGERGRDEFTLANVDLGDADSATVPRKVITNIGATTSILSVTGTVFFKNGTQSVPAESHLRDGDLTVVVTNTTRGTSSNGSVDDDGGYDVNFLDFEGGIVAETGDNLTVEVKDEADEIVGMTPHTLTTTEVMASNAEVDVDTTVPAQVRILDVTGSVVELDGSSPGAGLEVTITLVMSGHPMIAETMTDAAGGYNYTFVQLDAAVAATGDILMVDVLREVDQYHGHTGEITLHSYDLVDQQLTVDPITLIPPVLELGGLSINPHYTGIQDPMVQQLLNIDLTQLASMGDSVGVPAEDLLALAPMLSPILGYISSYQLDLPAGFDPGDENIAMESFGNAITTRPTAWVDLQERDTGRWVNGDQLNLYLSGAPTIDSVTFTLNNGAAMPAMSVPAGGTFPYTFQLEEELIALFEGHMPAFGSVQLAIDGHPQSPFEMTRNDMGVWSAEAMLSPGSTVAYHYMVTLARPYHDPIGGLTIVKFPHLDPRNRQLKIDSIAQAIDSLLQSELQMLEGIRSVFSVPAVDYQQSLWVGTLPLGADGAYTLDVDVSYRGGYAESITGRTFTVDRTPPTAAVSLNPEAPGHNAGMYSPADGLYVATGPEPGAASLTVSIPGATSNEPDGSAYMFQLAKLDALGNPGTWNPVVAADLMPLNLGQIITDPGSVLPLTAGGPIEMLIRSSEGSLIGTYGLRAVGIDSLLNMDSGRSYDLVLELVTPDPDILEVTSVHADFNGDLEIGADETQSTAGDVVVFSDSTVTLIVDTIERTRHGLKSVAIEVEIPGLPAQQVAMFGADQLAALGDHFTVPLPVPDIPSLPDRGGQVILRTITTNRLDVANAQEVPLLYQRQTPPEVSAVHTTVMDRHPSSSAAQGLITVSAFTQAMTTPKATAVQFEIRRTADADWTLLGFEQLADSKVVSRVQIAIIEDQIDSILNGAMTAPILPLYREWSLTFDSTRLPDGSILEDTILDDTPAATDASLDDNPYVVRAIALDMDSVGYESTATDGFSLDNYSPTEITTVANEVEMVMPREDDSYYVSGLIADGVPDPMLTLTAWTGAHPNAFIGGIKLAVNDAAGEAVEIAETAFSSAGNYNYTAAFNLGSISNGMYTFMAVGHIADGAVEERIVAMAISVEVGNFTPPENFADPTVDILNVINTRGDALSPSEIDAQYVTGFPAIGDEVCATLIVPNVAASDVDILIGDDGMSAAMMGALTVMDPDADNNISVCLDTSGLGEGMYSLVGMVNKPNGSVAFGLPSIQVDRSAPVIAIVSPLEGHQVTSLPTIQVSYSDATGFDPEKRDPRAIEISLTRLGSHKEVTTNPEMIRSVTAAGEVLTQSGSFSYTHDEPLSGGAYRIDVSVTDTLGHTANAAPVEFTSTGVEAAVSIMSPAGGQTFDLKQPMVIEAALAGNGAITVTEFTLNGTAVTPTVTDNQLSYAVRPTLERYFERGYRNFVVIKIEDEEGNTAEATAQFSIALDTKPPQVVSYSPQGTVRTDMPEITVTASDESGIRANFPRITVDGIRSGDQSSSSSGGSSTTVFTPSNAVGPGTYTVTASVEDKQGNRISFDWQFAVELDVTPPSITATSPHGVIRTESPVISVSASDDRSGVDTIEISVTDGSNQAVQGNAQVASNKTSATFTPAGALPSGVYSVDVQVTDMRGNTASSQWQFTIELDTIAPSILSTRPTQEHTENRRPTISATYTDNLSGVNAGSVAMWVDGKPVQPDSVSDTQVVYTPTSDLDFGQHTVKLQVSDKAPRVNTADVEWVFYVERMGIANARNYPNPFDHETMIAFRISRQASISVRIYDFTGRLVAEPVTNQIHEAGLVEIDWHGETDAEEHLARGVYFCHILMESELEPQSAILKMAIISE
jgi:hypothetical protein